MSILVPYHLDEHLADFDWPIATERIVSADVTTGSRWERLGRLYREVAVAVAEEAPGAVVITGDCLTALGTVAGLQRAGLEPCVVWLDAHGDVQTVETSTSGYLAGMPLRMLAGYGRSHLADSLGLSTLSEDRLMLVGARDLDPPEAEYLAKARIARCEVDELTAERVPAGAIYLHLDIDVVDAGELPGLLFPASGGPSLAAVTAAVRRVMATGRVAAMGIACSWHRGAGGPVREAVARMLS